MPTKTLQLHELSDSLVEAWNAALDAAEQPERVQLTQALVKQVKSHADPSLAATSLLWATYDNAEALAKGGASTVVAQLILYGGANPLDYLLEKGSVPVEMLWPTMAALRRREEQEQPMRLYDGGSAVHYWCSIHLFGHLRMLLRAPHMFSPKWVRETRHDGCTPLMVAWDTMINNYSTPEDIWEISGLLLDQGCDPLVKDKHGKDMLDRLQEVRTGNKSILFEIEDPYRDAVVGRIDAVQQVQALDGTTPFPTTAKTARTRL